MSRVKREYHQTERAKKTASTRQRIVEAGIKLHSTMGPARTTLSAVAKAAGVSRPTLYSHFPDEAGLIRACTGHWLAQDPPPDPQDWLEIAESGERMRVALHAVYAHFERNEQMLENVLRDMNLVEAMRRFNKPLVEQSFAAMTATLTAAFGDDLAASGRLRAMISLAISFDTWKHLVRIQQLTADQAVNLMVHSVQCVAHELEPQQ